MSNKEAENIYIFYPGGKVEYTAYAPLMQELASEGILCVLVEMPCNLGSYSTTDLSSTDLNVLSVYGSEDQVLDQVKYNENKVNLPYGFKEVVIDGGCHAYFGIYDPQEGDGQPTITSEEQITITVDAIIDWMN